ncbi:hypothetical protein K438DRAFT_1568016, partial [Mycena galopus ATCC 62051]
LLIIPVNRNSNTYFDLVSFSILFYEYWITLDWEISRYWGTRLSWPKALFFANRYGTLLGNIPVGASSYVTRCLALESYHQYFIIATQVLVGAMLILRSYALYEHSKRVLALMITVTVGSVVVGLWSVLTGKSVDKSTNLPLYFGCDYPTSRAQGLSLAAAWGSVAVFDCMIFLLTLYQGFTRRRLNGSLLLAVLLRDGAVYFGVMVLSNLSNIATFVVSEFNPPYPYTRGIATTFTNIISSVMITRLMFNIRDPALAHMAGTVTQSTVTAGIRFAPYRREDETGQPTVELDTDVDATMGKWILIRVDTYSNYLFAHRH